jgi:hypothetical protein
LLVSDAVAGSVNVFFGGSVVGALPGDTFPGNVRAGDAINTNSAFGYNSSQTGLNGKYVFTGSAQSFTLNVKTPGFPTTLWSDGFSGSPNNFTITMSKSGSTSKMDLHIATAGGTAEAGSKINAAVDLVLTSTTYTGGITLPTATTINSFLLTPASLTWDPPGLGGEGFTGYIDIFNGQTVPEPSSLVLAIVGFATCTGGILISRRKEAGASRKGRIIPRSAS